MPVSDSFEVRVSRKLLLLLTLTGLLFLAAGLEIAFFHKVLGADFGRDAPFIKAVFLVFAIGAGGAIALNCLLYLFAPPLMLRVTTEWISFGVGLRYRQFRVPAALFERVAIFTVESDLEVLGKRKTVQGGIDIYFKNDDSIPSRMATSMGLAYSGYVLRVLARYAGRSCREMVEGIESVLKKS